LHKYWEKHHEATNNPCGTAAGIGGSVCVNYLCPVEAGGVGMTKDEALKLALDALESVLANHNGAPVMPWIEARDAIKQARSAPTVQECLAHGECFGGKCIYTTPPAAQRQWVGLTDEEMYLNCPNWLSQEQCKVWVQQIEAKLKEKNAAAQPAVPDAIGPNEDELPAYAAGWNDCRQAMLEMMK
jgi:hypothetical protein